MIYGESLGEDTIRPRPRLVFHHKWKTLMIAQKILITAIFVGTFSNIVLIIKEKL